MRRLFGCDPRKRQWLLDQRYFDLLDMAGVFDDKRRLDYIDRRYDYGEERHVTIGQVLDHTFTVVYTMRGSLTWLITAWPSNRKERDRYGNG